VPKDVNPSFEHEAPNFGPADHRDPTPDQIVINDEPSARDDLSEEEWVEVRTVMRDFVAAVRELPLDDTEFGFDTGEISDDYESMPADVHGVDAGTMQSKTLNRMADELEDLLIAPKPDRVAICGVVQQMVVLLETLGFSLMQEGSLALPLEEVSDIARWWRIDSSIADQPDVDPAFERMPDLDFPQPRPTV
jgi:hypothetical protein